MKIEALTEHYQTRRKSALNRVPVETEKWPCFRRLNISGKADVTYAEAYQWLFLFICVPRSS